MPDDRRRAPCSTTPPPPSWPGSGQQDRGRTSARRRTSSGRGPAAGSSSLQSRPITALPDAGGRSADRLAGARPDGAYFRASIVEQLPDPLSPLFADLVDGSVTRSLQAPVAASCWAGTSIRDGDVGLPTVNGYAYYRYSRAGMAPDAAQPPAAFGVLSATSGHGGQGRWRDYAHPRYRAVVDALDRATGRRAAPATELLAGVAELLDAGTEYYTAVQTIIPLAATSEVVFTGYYDRLVRRAGDPPAATFLLGFDSLPIRAEKSLYDLAGWTREQPELAAGDRDAVGRLVASAATGPADAGGATRSGASGAPASRTTSTASGTPSTTSTSPTRCRPTTRPR